MQKETWVCIPASAGLNTPGQFMINEAFLRTMTIERSEPTRVQSLQLLGQFMISEAFLRESYEKMQRVQNLLSGVL